MRHYGYRRNTRVRDNEPATISGSFAFGRIGGKFWEAARLYDPTTKTYFWAVSGVHTAADRAAALAQLPDPNRRTNRARSRNPRRVTNEDPVERYVPVRNVAQGTFVKRKADSRKVYIRRDYDRVERKYALEDTDNMNRVLYVKGDALVFVGFEY